MEIKQIKGNTYYLDSWESIPFYKTDDTHCILLDTGTVFQTKEIEEALDNAGLKIAGILGSHVHTDHSANNGYFQQKYGIPVAFPAGEAAVVRSDRNLFAYFYNLSPAQFDVHPEAIHMPYESDILISKDQKEMDFCGAHFRIYHTPGHSLDHIAVLTDDNVFYLGDALMTVSSMTSMKLPYFFDFKQTMESYELIRSVKADYYLCTHRGVLTDVNETVDFSIKCLNEKSDLIASLVTEPMLRDKIQEVTCKAMGIDSNDFGMAIMLERNMRPYVNYCVDTGRLIEFAENGTIYFKRA